MQQVNHDLVAITKAWWNHSYAVEAAVEGSKFFGRDKQGRRGCELSLYIKKHFDAVELEAGNFKAETLWVKVRGKTNKNDIAEHPPRMKGQMNHSVCSWQNSRFFPCAHGRLQLT